MATLTILSGAPGSGKSTMAEYYVTLSENTVIVASDEIRKELWGSYDFYDKEKEHLLWDTLLTRAKEYGERGVNVILDSTAVTNNKRMWFFNELKDSFDAVHLEIFRPPFEVCLERNCKRDRHVPEAAIRRLYDNCEVPSWEVYINFTSVEFIFD